MNISFSKISVVASILLTLTLFSGCSSLQRRSTDGSFEGVVNVIERYGDSEEMAINTTYYVKPAHLRMESSRAWADEVLTVTLYDYDHRIMYTLLPNKKVYMEAALLEKEKVGDIPADTTHQGTGRLTKAKTGLVKDILGYRCEQWIFSSETEGQLEMWMAKGFPMLEGALGRKQDFSNGGDTPMSPFLMIIRTSNGNEVMHWEIIDIKDQEIEDSFFLPPRDYKKIERTHETNHK